jgi:ferritin-like metal-binding protein YciE
MADLNDRDQKLVQYLNEAYGKEKELEAALQAHIGMTSRAPYRKRLQQHLRETKAHARQVERRIKRIGGDPQMLQRLAGQATAALKGQVHALRGSSEDEKVLKNAKTEYSEEAEEIATYTAIEAFAENVGDRDTAKLARGIRREEERMAKYLEGLIPQLTRAVVRSEIPSDQRANGRATARGRTTRRPTTGRRTTGRPTTGRRTTRRPTTGRRATRRPTTRRPTTGRRTTGRRAS